ncbi:hypothetical protein N0B31_12635 [Salinirubellus salinus]|uniref:Uncharacterized protein n=1 Tax=Salinirubellus salinus TaxID=1364945 RepID=A0A9E7U393_9EURY|nr:hypothetical protein [Salinirubellus salinus]UWM52995.1 hypothetical protein N0B31_12635 [Salinirubellus salinus]
MRRTVERVEPDAEPDPIPADFFEDDDVRATASLEAGWVALSDTELLRYHPDGEPPLARVPLPNVAALELQRTGGGRLLAFVPRLVTFGMGALVAGLVLRGFSLPTSAAEGAGTEGLGSLLGVLSAALSTLASGLLLGGVGLVFLAVCLVGVALSRRETELAVERAGGASVTCPVGERAGKRALRALEPGLAGGAPREGDEAASDEGSLARTQSSAETPVERSSSR